MKEMKSALYFMLPGLILFLGAAGIQTAANATDDDTPKKVYVCKYVGTPGDDEQLQTGNNPIEVSVNAIPDGAKPGDSFGDDQGRSYVLAYVPQSPEPTRSDCPTNGPNPSPTPTVTVTETVPGPTVTVTESVPGPTVTVTESVPGPETTVTETAEVPGPTVTATETETVEVPGPTTTATETVTVKVIKSADGTMSTKTSKPTAGELPKTGGNGSDMALLFMGLGSLMFGTGIVMAARARPHRH
jgi:LPXTG-motif cell wall-anchored protein